MRINKNLYSRLRMDRTDKNILRQKLLVDIAAWNLIESPLGNGISYPTTINVTTFIDDLLDYTGTVSYNLSINRITLNFWNMTDELSIWIMYTFSEDKITVELWRNGPIKVLSYTAAK